MGPGVDPHLYKASAGDVRELVEADLILYGGLELEGKMSDAFERLADQRPTAAVTEAIPRGRLRAEPQYPDRYDPHVWFDPTLWRHAVDAAADALARGIPRPPASTPATRGGTGGTSRRWTPGPSGRSRQSRASSACS
jgi:manganese/zinc/iron transport system substrate-binding protein